MMGGHHDRHDRKIEVKNRERIQRLEVELRRLILLEKKEAGLNHPFIVAKLKLDIQRVLRDCNDDKRETARRLGLGLSSLYRKLEELEIRP